MRKLYAKVEKVFDTAKYNCQKILHPPHKNIIQCKRGFVKHRGQFIKGILKRFADSFSLFTFA